LYDLLGREIPTPGSKNHFKPKLSNLGDSTHRHKHWAHPNNMIDLESSYLSNKIGTENLNYTKFQL